MIMEASRGKRIGDYMICLAVFIQPVLVLMQHIMIDVFRMDPDMTTNYRVLLTAIPMLMGIGIGFSRKAMRFAIVYCVAIVAMLYTIAFFPDNEKYVRYEGLRFLLPLIIPSAVCLTTVTDICVLRKSLYIMAWAGAVLVVYYMLSYFAGVFYIDAYNMSFSYGCLLPMIVLYSQKKWLPTLVSFFMFLTVVAIGSRGSAGIYVAFLIVDFFVSRRKNQWIVLALAVLLFAMLPMFADFLSGVGLRSRTLGMLNAGNISYDSGREQIYTTCLDTIWNHPLFGVGLFGDRVLLEGAYCHNFFIEVLMDFGVLFGLAIFVVLICLFLRSLRATKTGNRDLLLVFTFGSLLPHMVSGSYLISNNVALWIGLVVILSVDSSSSVSERVSVFEPQVDRFSR